MSARYYMIDNDSNVNSTDNSMLAAEWASNEELVVIDTLEDVVMYDTGPSKITKIDG